jgi:hypothetical protein
VPALAVKREPPGAVLDGAAAAALDADPATPLDLAAGDNAIDLDVQRGALRQREPEGRTPSGGEAP